MQEIEKVRQFFPEIICPECTVPKNRSSYRNILVTVISVIIKPDIHDGFGSLFHRKSRMKRDGRCLKLSRGYTIGLLAGY